ncbi:MAG: sensor histidine kinase [Kiloniellales bacterium]
MNETIEAEIRGLAEQYRNEGLVRLSQVIRERSSTSPDSANVYLLADPDFRSIVGNLNSWPEQRVQGGGWNEITLRRGREPGSPPHRIRTRTFQLPGGYHLLVGRDTEALGAFRGIMIEAIAWTLGPALILGLLGGALIGRYAQSRVDAVRAIGQDIVKGDLSRRVPLTGSGDEFDRLARTINEMLEQIDTLMAGMRMVTDSLAHDLRSPLTRAKSSIEMALRKGDGESQRKALEQTSAELETILNTFEALIRIAQAETGINRLSLSRLDLTALARDVSEIYQPIAEEKGLETIDAIESGISVMGHRNLLAQALANLLDNAIKYTPSGGRIEVSLRHAGDAPILTVCDSGPGIPEAEWEGVLQRFVRLDSSRGTSGSGLGLSLVAAVANLHGAQLTLGDNAPGLAVSLSFPELEARPQAPMAKP